MRALSLDLLVGSSAQSGRWSMWHVCVFAAEPTSSDLGHSIRWVLFQVECRNYIRTLHGVNATTMYVCGTNAFSPTCDYMVSARMGSV